MAKDMFSSQWNSSFSLAIVLEMSNIESYWQRLVELYRTVDEYGIDRFVFARLSSHVYHENCRRIELGKPSDTDRLVGLWTSTILSSVLVFVRFASRRALPGLFFLDLDCRIAFLSVYDINLQPISPNHWWLTSTHPTIVAIRIE